MKPGRPARLALYRDPATGKTLPVMALPGSPGAMMTAFYILARPALSKLLGERQGASWRLNATLIGSLRGARGRTQYIPASLHINQGALEVRPSSSAGASWRRPGVASRIDAYIELDGNDLTTPDGSIVTVVVV
jgi:molybdopterin biosynthesis enzyme